MAHSYSRAGNGAWSALEKSKDADFAAPAIICDTFAVELLLKFFIAADHPDCSTYRALEKKGVKLRSHTFTELYGRVSIPQQELIAAQYSALMGSTVSVPGFRDALAELGAEPFVYWRYVYEKAGESHLDPRHLSRVLDALGKAAELTLQASGSSPA